jgi:hypothetical protein
LQILRLFRDGGFQAIAERIETAVPEDQRELASQAYIKLMYNGLQTGLPARYSKMKACRRSEG